MKIHEYQAKDIFAAYGIPVEKYILCTSATGAGKAFDELNRPVAVIKAQVLTGGRGKAGGVKLVRTRQECEERAKDILGLTIKGFPVEKLVVMPAVDIESEYYISFITDRNTKSVVLIMSKEGGMEIEDVAKNTPGKILKFAIDPQVGIPDFLARRFAFSLFDQMDDVNKAAQLIQSLYKIFIEKDASLTEINPLVKTAQGDILAVDAKITFDDNALFRHPGIHALFEPTDEEKVEASAKEKGFSYVHLGGQIGCMVNGAGLAMATMDMVKLYGGQPANFLDIGGSSNPNKVVEAMKLLLSDKQVKTVLINIFGGITRCDDVAAGLLTAFGQLKTDIPVVVRLTGTNEKKGREMLKGSRFHICETMGEAARKAIELSKQ